MRGIGVFMDIEISEFGYGFVLHIDGQIVGLAGGTERNRLKNQFYGVPAHIDALQLFEMMGVF
jgi:hypothetical protein